MKKLIILFISSFAPFFILWGWVLVAQIQNQSSNWMRFLGNEIEVTFKYFTAGKLYNVLLLFSIPVIALFLKNKFSESIKNIKRFNESLFYIFIIMSISLLVPFIISFFKPIYIVERGPIIAAAPFALLLGGYLCSISYKPLFYSVLTLFAFYLYIKLYSFTGVDYRNERTLAKFLLLNASKTDKITFYDEIKRPLKYYFKLYKFNNQKAIIDSPELMGYLRSIEWNKISEIEKEKIINEYCSKLESKGRLMFVYRKFRKEESDYAPLKAVLARLNKSFKVEKTADCLSIEMVIYNKD